MFAPDNNSRGNLSGDPLDGCFLRSDEAFLPEGIDFTIMRQYLPMVNAVLGEMSDRLPVDCDRQEVVSVGTVALARALTDFGDHGVGSFEDYARTQITDAIGREFASGAPSSPAPVVPVAREVPGEVDLSGRKILIVEDSAMIRKKVRYLLEKAHFDVYEAKSGEEGIWLAQECLPDLILLDVVMDRLDGFETCERIKALPDFADVPIVFLTGKTETEFIARGFSAGGSDYIGKPFNPQEAFPRIRTHLKIRVLSAFRQRNIDELKKLNNAKDKLLRMASHDLRNPLSAINGLADMLRMGAVGELNEEQKEVAATIHSASGSMMQMLTDLLDLSTLESNVVRLDVAEQDPAELVSSLVNLFKVSASRKEIELKLVKRGESSPLPMDGHQVRRLLENFLSNAIKFSPRGTTVSMVLWQTEERCYFDVEDEGPGIAPEEQKLLFKEFSRTSNKPTGGEKSTGLGLSICRKIAEAHHGAVSMSNLEQGGSRFRLELPRKRPEISEAPSSENASTPHRETAFR